MLGHEAGLWFPTGTMANQVAIRTLTRPGDEVLAPREAHILWHETGGAAANERRPADGDRAAAAGGSRVGRRPCRAQAARPHAPAADDRRRRREHPQPGRRRRDRRWSTSLAIADAARATELATFLDGARLWNAAAALDVPVAELARPFDVVSVAFSKGLGAPGGSMLGGLTGVRRRGDPLPADGRRRDAPGRRLRGGRRATPSTTISSAWPTTTPTPGSSPSGWRRARRSSSTRPPSRRTSSCSGWRTARPTRRRSWPRARAAGVLVVAFNARTIRAVTHLDVTRDQVAEAAERLVAAAESAAPA